MVQPIFRSPISCHSRSRWITSPKPCITVVNIQRLPDRSLSQWMFYDGRVSRRHNIYHLGINNYCCLCRVGRYYEKMVCNASATLEMHAGCMQAACRLHAGCMQPATSCMQDAATCNLLHTIVCRLHEACMKPACRLQPPACSLLQPATSCIRSYSQKARQSAQLFVDTDVQGVDAGVQASTPFKSV